MSDEPTGIVIQFPPRVPETDDAKWTDEHGVDWFQFLCEYDFGASIFSFFIWATGVDDAQARLRAIGASGNVQGPLYAVVDAGDITPDDLPPVS